MKTKGDTQQAFASQTVRILVAEDSPLNQQVALKQLEALGYEADAVADGDQVLAALERRPYNIILMDCHMPQMSGYEAAWQIRNTGKHPRGETRPAPYIIAMTANTDADSRERCRAAGMDDYVRKPVQMAELEAALVRALAARVDFGVPVEVIDPVVITGLRRIHRAGQADPVREFVDLFLREAPQQLDAMERAAGGREVASLAELLGAATSLKGGAFNLGARRLASTCDEIEQGAKGRPMAEMLPLIRQAREDYAQAREALEKILAAGAGVGGGEDS